MTEVKTIISDADGTLVDTMDLIRHGQFEAIDNYLRQREIPTEQLPSYEVFEDTLHRLIGGSARHTLEITVKDLFKENPSMVEGFNYDDLHNLLNPSQDRLAPTYVRAYPGLSDFLHGIGKLGLGFAIWTSGTRHHIMRNFGVALPELNMGELYKSNELSDDEKFKKFSAVFQEFFGLAAFSILTCEDITTHKPDPEGLTIVMTRLDADPGSTMVLGDHTVDMQAGVNAKVAFRTAIVHGFGKAEQLAKAGANLVVTSLSELSAHLTK